MVGWTGKKNYSSILSFLKNGATLTVTHKRFNLQQDESRLKGERDYGKWRREIEEVQEGGRRGQRKKRTKRAQTERERERG